MGRSAKSKLIKTPYIGYLLRMVHDVVKSPRIADQRELRFRKLEEEAVKQSEQSSRIEKQVSDVDAKLAEINKLLDAVRVTQDNLARQVESAPKQKASAASSDENNGALFADDHTLDVFYAKFEDRFRGTEKLITDRLKEYLPLFKSTPVDFKKYPVLDIGSGRGEFLQLLKAKDIKAKGLDINHDMVKRSKEKGLDVIQGDVVTFLHKEPAQKYGAITGFHLVEHIPFNILMKMFMSAHRCLKNDGFVLFETPNPENVTVGSNGFYMDPSHLNPLPPALLAFALETCGFRNIEIKRLHPAVQPDNLGAHEQIANYFYGPLDYAVIAYK